eukprot:m.660994 g.660994  ORF g.660994 m.660994 type:complete len:433 (-) comp22733_c0_seq8:1243-2541(-)
MDHTGWLKKSPPLNNPDDATGFKKWKNRWFALSGSLLMYFTDEEQNELKGTIDLSQCQKVYADISTSRRRNMFSIKCKDREYFLASANDAERIRWVLALTHALERATNGSGIVMHTARPTSICASHGEERAAAVEEVARQKAARASTVPGASSPPNHCGFLLKSPPLGGAGVDNCSMKRWRRRWFALRGVLLSYSGDHLEGDRKGDLNLLDCIGLNPDVAHEKQPFMFSLIFPHREYFLAAESEEGRNSWIKAIASSVGAEIPSPDAAADQAKDDGGNDQGRARAAQSFSYNGPTLFQVEYEGTPATLVIKPPRLNLLRKAKRPKQGGGYVIVDSMTNTWPLAQLHHAGFTQTPDGVFSFTGGTLDEIPGKVYTFRLAAGDDLKKALDTVQEATQRARRWSGSAPLSVAYTKQGLEGESAKVLNQKMHTTGP